MAPQQEPLAGFDFPPTAGREPTGEAHDVAADAVAHLDFVENHDASGFVVVSLDDGVGDVHVQDYSRVWFSCQLSLSY